MKRLGQKIDFTKEKQLGQVFYYLTIMKIRKEVIMVVMEVNCIGI